ncbi:MAG: hypothetical protein LBF37_03540 [Rickettsiales bacterium]|jgi:hypothetical protein|nr:hypothetical protein [Rickettsiales bacterium]
MTDSIKFISDQNFSHINYEKPRVIILGGMTVETPKQSGWYISQIKKLLDENNISGVDIYSAHYEFDPDDRIKEYIQKLRDKSPEISIETLAQILQKPSINISRKFFDVALRPNITDKNNPDKRIDTDEAIQNIRRQTLFMHCFGYNVASFAISHILKQEMLNFGYSPSEIFKFQSNIFGVAFSPFTPKKLTPVRIMSFGSATDKHLFPRTIFHNYLVENSADLPLALFDEKYNAFFTAKQLRTKESLEHHLLGLPAKEVIPSSFTADGAAIFNIMRNILVNGIKRSIQGAAIPNNLKLITDEKIDVNKMLQDGKQFRHSLAKDLRSRRRQ